jgi:hypothetical protein
MSVQSLTVNYTSDMMKCLLCNCVNESNGNMLTTDDCKHTFHISCLIDCISDNDCHMQCPECSTNFDDIRVLLAVAYRAENTDLFVQALLPYT